MIVKVTHHSAVTVTCSQLRSDISLDNHSLSDTDAMSECIVNNTKGNKLLSLAYNLADTVSQPTMGKNKMWHSLPLGHGPEIRILAIFVNSKETTEGQKGVLCLFICIDVKVRFVVAGDPEDTSDDMPLLFSPAGAASPGTGHASSDLELQEHCHGLEPVRDSGKVARRQLALATLLCTVFVTGEVVGGWVSGSLAIMSDAAHMFSDLASFGVSLLVLYVSERKATKKMTFGYHRAEALGALATLCIIWYVTGILVYLAVRRIHDNDFEIHETAMVVVASCAVVFNILLGLILHGVCGLGHGHSHGGGHGHSHGAGGDTKHINIRAAAIHVLGDLLQSIGVLISSVLIKCFGPEFKIADPICTLVFAVIVVVTTFTVLRDTLAILLEGAPPGLKYDVVATDLASIGDVVSTHLPSLSALIIILFARQVSVHSLHIWSLTADIPVLSVHLTTKQDADHNIIRNEAIK